MTSTRLLSSTRSWMEVLSPNTSGHIELALTRLPITVQFPRQFVNFAGFGWPKVGDPNLRSAIAAITDDAILTHASYAQHNAEYGEAHMTKFGGADQATARLILSHLWTVWRDSLNLPIAVPYLFGTRRDGIRYYSVVEFLPDFPYSDGVIEHEAMMCKWYNKGSR